MSAATPETLVTAFEGTRRIAAGPLTYVARAVRSLAQSGFPLLVFADASARVVDIDFRGTEEEVLARFGPAPEPKGPGRPKLGVVAREVTLLPRHWDWLASQPGGASVALRKLVEEAAKSPAAGMRRAQEVANRFMTAMGGNLPDYEEATRALFAADEGAFLQRTQGWPADVRDYARTLAAPVFPVV